MTISEFNRVLQKLLEIAGVDDHIKSHSFRIGGATSHYANNVTDDKIKSIGRWSTNCFQRYIRMSNVTLAPNTVRIVCVN